MVDEFIKAYISCNKNYLPLNYKSSQEKIWCLDPIVPVRIKPLPRNFYCRKQAIAHDSLHSMKYKLPNMMVQHMVANQKSVDTARTTYT